MRKLLAFAFAIATIGFVTPSTTNAAEPQRDRQNRQERRDDRNRRNDRYGHYNRRVRVVTQSRIVRYGRSLYRETYRVRYFPNGRIQTTLISRVRIR